MSARGRIHQPPSDWLSPAEKKAKMILETLL